MVQTRTFLGAALLGTLFTLMPTVVRARSATAPNGIAVPAATCTSAFEVQWHGYFRTPESDGRPGYKFYALGVDKLCRDDFAGAIHLFKVAGSWGYKPAEYSLGVLYFRGAGVPVNRPLGAAWMELAAETGIPKYVKVRDLMVTILTPGQITQTKQLRGQLEPTYGMVALRRARWQWKLAGEAETGSHIGHPVAPVISDISPLLSAYYRVMQENDDPYPDLDGFLTGRATVGPLEPLGSKGVAKGGSAQPAPGGQSDHENQKNPD